MTASLGGFIGLILAVAVERLHELGLSRRNARWALERGGREFGRRHFPAMVALHAALLAAAPAEAWWFDRPFVPVLAAVALAVVGAAMALRYWAIRTLGRRWNTRVLVVPGLPSVTAGPYRWLRHPNYLAVIAEGVALPLVHSAWATALGFSILNAWLLRHRIRCEEAALAATSEWARSFAALPRLVPGMGPVAADGGPRAGRSG